MSERKTSCSSSAREVRGRIGYTKRLKANLEAWAWVFAAIAVLVYGNGRHDFITVVLHHPAVWRCEILVILA